jgi:uncharacterized protein (TIGR02118 family)
MVKLVILYKTPPDVAAFDAHYFNTHVNIANKIPGLLKTEFSQIFGSATGKSEYHLMAELYFEDMNALNAGMSSPQGEAAAQDVMGFARGLFSMHFAEVIEEKHPVKV